jgi:Fanconi anemia group M protein
MVSLKNIEPREYQKNIAETANKKNTLVVLPTGMGKTLVAIMVAIKRLNDFPESKALVMAPTRPLNAQHKKSFEKFTDLNEEEIALVTGKIRPEKRIEIYKKAKVVIATPQTIQNDVENGRISLSDFSFLVFDEAHRCVKDYAYTYVAKKYKEQAKHPLILGLTASPGGSFERIEEIKKNLFIEAVEIRTELDEDVKKYVKPIAKDWIYVELPEEMKMVKGLLEEMLKEPIYWLKEHNFIQTYKPTKKVLLSLQNSVASKYMQGSKNFSLAWAMIKSAEAIKIEHAIELLETQDISSLLDYLKKLELSNKRIDKKISKDPRMKDVIKILESIKDIKHPKLEKLKNLVKDLIKENPNVKIIVFANYRATVEKIKEVLDGEGIKSKILIGQATKEGKGMTQEEQIDTLRRFKENEFNTLIATSIGEEGLDVPAVHYVIFYESVPSELRRIQRSGRTGRTAPGKIIFLITKDTRDESYYWASFVREKKMKGILYNLKERKKKKTLKDFLN